MCPDAASVPGVTLVGGESTDMSTAFVVSHRRGYSEHDPQQSEQCDCCGHDEHDHDIDRRIHSDRHLEFDHVRRLRIHPCRHHGDRERRTPNRDCVRATCGGAADVPDARNRDHQRRPYGGARRPHLHGERRGRHIGIRDVVVDAGRDADPRAGHRERELEQRGAQLLGVRVHDLSAECSMCSEWDGHDERAVWDEVLRVQGIVEHVVCSVNKEMRMWKVCIRSRSYEVDDWAASFLQRA